MAIQAIGLAGTSQRKTRCGKVSITRIYKKASKGSQAQSVFGGASANTRPTEVRTTPSWTSRSTIPGGNRRETSTCPREPRPAVKDTNAAVISPESPRLTAHRLEEHRLSQRKWERDAPPANCHTVIGKTSSPIPLASQVIRTNRRPLRFPGTLREADSRPAGSRNN